MRKYHHIYKRKDYPLKNGYRMEPFKLPDWIYITVTQEANKSKVLRVHSRIHMNKEVKVGPSYSNDYTDDEIIKDLSGEISYRFL